MQLVGLSRGFKITAMASSDIHTIPLKNDSGGGLISVGDFNDDGRPDIVAASYGPAGFNVVLNNGNDNFQSLKKHTAGESIESITTADVDNNHTTDIVSSDFYSLQVTVHRNFGNAVFQRRRCLRQTVLCRARLMRQILMAMVILMWLLPVPAFAATGIRVMVQK